jgi:membrane protease YdiL (CAAX protease family)
MQSSESQTRLLRPFWAAVLPPPWVVAVILAAVIVAWRGFLMLGPSRGTGPWMAVHFLTLAAAPLVLLDRDGRRRIGLSRRVSFRWLITAGVSGAVAAAIIGAIGGLVYGESQDNWFVTIGEAMLADGRLRALPIIELFVALAIPAALFSPIGEELFFRGMFHESLALRAGHVYGSGITAVVFGVMHLFHHGISAGPAGVDIRGVSGLVWVVFTVGLSLLFTLWRLRSSSIWSAVLCHAGFNVAMVACIVLAQS